LAEVRGIDGKAGEEDRWANTVTAIGKFLGVVSTK
jgi:hypothetical protein